MTTVSQDSFDTKDLHEIEGEVIKEYVWKLQEKCRSDRNWGIGKFLCNNYCT